MFDNDIKKGAQMYSTKKYRSHILCCYCQSKSKVTALISCKWLAMMGAWMEEDW